MTKFSAALMVSIAIVASAGAAQAQLFGPRPEPRTVGPGAMPENMDPAMCDQLASIPNAPMSAEACRSMMGMGQSMKAGASDPSAMRPGDESMSCDQIMAEMQIGGGPMVSQSTATQSKEASEATMALMEKQNAEAKAFMARQMAIGIGAGALGMLPGGGIASSAIMAGQQAQTQAFAEKQQADAAPVRARQNQALTAITTEVGQGMQDNPRVARLSQLMADKNCQVPQDAGVRAR